MKPRELLKILKQNGWVEVGQRGSHLYLKHPTKKGKISVPIHNKDFKLGTLNNILKQAGLK
ncbi:type II toxin-antitoxin system HicA family toxin [Clostridioides sp. ZZV14-6044]|uniref:type II toxin-antitoxin system HicA family toxin n=1 Tax=unclassified Clostridioides TaxID=2635829 RepID=UPI001D0CC111|nr:type II toxin-antitoxin system HicA family toxin [Clostridioides sp. ES-S-0001-02]MCC0660369.1 type II toxin-antitoxin system HicA family toxin [Clostridioides sp. ZZV14-6154]MCC0683190.1 type II toxin-antitoxin system HicA family toxin [Clostridioides sp. ZZV14-6345]MCC0720829.1 type II toxin-antitoxin system HicA family toxin [Clostridioides sp. ZZV14-6104]MCC0741362.1 type II toxin-antitoxin system HicA family toxin [Clostridioides sp. ZZV14-6044]MCC0749543.1 type II toxin-antitoxin syst